MSEILFLSHRIPFPPDKGDKIRSYHLLRALAERHTVHLGTFVDDKADWHHVDSVQKLCAETCIQWLNPVVGKIRSAAGLIRGEPLTMGYYRDRRLHRWVNELAARRPLAGIFVFSSSMAQYASGLPLQPGAVRVLDFCDVDSDKWRQYAGSHGFPLSWVYAREARTLAVAECQILREFDAGLVISAAEARVLREHTVDGCDRVMIVPNGVDTEYFNPARDFESPFVAGIQPIVFTGAMDYHANVDGVVWFARQVLPAVRARVPEAVFTIVGSNPTAEVRVLSSLPGVIVTGRVADVRPYLRHAAVVVAPLRISRGVQNKVLEALAMNCRIVATENAVQGIPAAVEAGVATVVRASEMAGRVVESLKSAALDGSGREFVETHYGWWGNLERAVDLFDGPSDGRHAEGPDGVTLP